MTRDVVDGLTAVVVAFRSADLLGACVDSLIAAGVAGVVVVDNNDDGRDADAVAGLVAAHPGVVQALTTGRNLGFGAACNLGASRALEHGAGTLWFVNPDTVADHAAAPRLVGGMRAQGFDLASPLLTTGPRDAETVWFGGGTFDVRTGRARHEMLGAPPGSAPHEPVECSFLNGAAVAVTREAWQRLGGFATDYFMYWEDSDLSVRATRAGLRLGMVPGAVVWHAEGASSVSDDPGRSALGYYYYTRNRLLLARRLGRFGAWFAGPGIVLTLKPIGAAFLTEHVSRWRKGAAALRGTRDGLAGRTGVEARFSATA